MSNTFRAYTPGQCLLLPPSPKDWLPEEHLARFLLDLVKESDAEPPAPAPPLPVLEPAVPPELVSVEPADPPVLLPPALEPAAPPAPALVEPPALVLPPELVEPPTLVAPPEPAAPPRPVLPPLWVVVPPLLEVVPPEPAPPLPAGLARSSGAGGAARSVGFWIAIRFAAPDEEHTQENGGSTPSEAVLKRSATQANQRPTITRCASFGQRLQLPREQ